MPIPKCLFALLLVASFVSAEPATFSATTGLLTKADGTTWQITVTEIERGPRVSVLTISHTGRLPSVGSSMFIACSILNLARSRGFRYVAQLETAATMKIGFLDRLDDDPAVALGAAVVTPSSVRKYDAETFAPVCSLISTPAPAEVPKSQ